MRFPPIHAEDLFVFAPPPPPKKKKKKKEETADERGI